MSDFKRVWLAVDGAGTIHGPFEFLSAKGGFVFYAAEKPLPEPWTLVLVDNRPNDPRPIREVALEALAATIMRVKP